MGGSVGCTENTKVRCRERKIRSDEDTALIQIDPLSQFSPIFKSPSVPFRPVCPNFKNANFWGGNLIKLGMGPLESLAHRESITEIASSGDSSQPSNEPFEGGHSTPFSQ